MIGSPGTALKQVRPGEAARAEDFNAVVKAVTELVLARLRTVRPEVVRCRVAAVNGAVEISGAEPACDLRAVTYDLQPIAQPDAARIMAVKPDLGRPWYVPGGGGSNPLVGVPAAEGDRAVVVRFPDGEGAFTNFVMIAERLLAADPCDA